MWNRGTNHLTNVWILDLVWNRGSNHLTVTFGYLIYLECNRSTNHLTVTFDYKIQNVKQEYQPPDYDISRYGLMKVKQKDQPDDCDIWSSTGAGAFRNPSIHSMYIYWKLIRKFRVQFESALLNQKQQHTINGLPQDMAGWKLNCVLQLNFKFYQPSQLRCLFTEPQRLLCTGTSTNSQNVVSLFNIQLCGF